MNFIMSDYDKIVSLQGIETCIQNVYFLWSNCKFKFILKFSKFC